MSAGDVSQHGKKLSVNYFKHLFGAKSGGQCRVRDTMLRFKPLQPRILCINDTPQEWLKAIEGMQDSDKLPLEKRLFCVHVDQFAISKEAVAEHKADLDAMVFDGKRRRWEYYLEQGIEISSHVSTTASGGASLAEDTASDSGDASPASTVHALDDSRAIRKGFHPNFISGEVLDTLWRYTLTRAPYHVHLRGKPVKSRPKINYGVPNENGEYGLYRWGQEMRDWHRVEDMPPELLAVIDEIEKVFGVRPNHAIATYYHNGKEQWIPAHRDKATTIGSKGGVENQTTIFNLSLGAMRPFIITPLSCLGETARGKLEIVDEFPMQFGDLYAMTGDINSRFGHCVAKDPSIQDLRVSYVFRCVSKDLVHPTQRYYREMDKAGQRIPLPEPEAEPLAEEEAAASAVQAPCADEGALLGEDVDLDMLAEKIADQ